MHTLIMSGHEEVWTSSTTAFQADILRANVVMLAKLHVKECIFLCPWDVVFPDQSRVHYVCMFTSRKAVR